MIEIQGESAIVTGGITIETVPSLVNSVSEPLLNGVKCIDLTGVTEVDSSSVALLLEWQRQAGERGMSLSWKGIPPALQNLADLYGVQEFLSAEA